MSKDSAKSQRDLEQLSIPGEELLDNDSRYLGVLDDVVELLRAGRQAAARSVNSIMTVS